MASSRSNPSSRLTTDPSLGHAGGRLGLVQVQTGFSAPDQVAGLEEALSVGAEDLRGSPGVCAEPLAGRPQPSQYLPDPVESHDAAVLIVETLVQAHQLLGRVEQATGPILRATGVPG